MSQLNRILIKFKNVYNKIVKEQTIKICIYASLLIFLPGLLIAVLIAFFFGANSYSIIDNYISDLGSIRHTPAPLVLDTIAMVTGILIVPIFFYLAKIILSNNKEIIFNSNESILRRIFYVYIDINGFIGLFSLITASIGLFGIGLFSEDRTTELGLHIAFSGIVFGGLAIGALFNGIAIALKKTIFPRFLGIYMVIGPGTATILFMLHPESVTLQFLEWIMLFSAFFWLIPVVFIILNNFKLKQSH
ncbi:MAG: hypothetical protein ACFE78_02960 [Candidatus Hodarchaeota archaeon]